MTTLSRFIAAATLISATAIAPGLAAADDHREGRDRSDDRYERSERYQHDTRFAPPRPVPAWARRDELRWDGRGWVAVGWSRAELNGRFVQARAVRLELSWLERERAAYHARFAWHPGRLARYDARYFERRAELERRLQRVTMYAWR